MLCDEVVAALAPRDGAIYVDGTFGAGGYSAALLDQRALAASSASTATPRRCGAVRPWPNAIRAGLTVVEGCFGDMERLVGDAAAGPIAGVTLDLGVSSMQLDEAERGFSFRLDGPLDMRMGPRAKAPPIWSPACPRRSSPS